MQFTLKDRRYVLMCPSQAKTSGKPVIVVAHDWGAIFGYMLEAEHTEVG